MSDERDEAMQEAIEDMTPHEKIAKLAAMSPEEFNRFMLWNFNRVCNETQLGPLQQSNPQRSSEPVMTEERNTMTSYLEETPEDREWALKEAAKPTGFYPHSESTVRLLKMLESEGLVRASSIAPCWYLTKRGRELIK